MPRDRDETVMSFSRRFICSLARKNHGRMAKIQSVRTAMPDGQLCPQNGHMRDERGLTGVDDGHGQEGNDTFTSRDGPVVEVLERHALHPEQDAPDDGDEGEADQDEPDDPLVLLLLDDSQQEQAQRPLGDQERHGGEGLAQDTVVGCVDDGLVLPDTR